jgi:hypothetical protein
MKKLTKILFLTAYFLLSCACLYSQSEAVKLDSLGSQEVLNQAWTIANLINGGAQWIPGLPNLILQSLSALALGLIIRHREKKKLRKQGLLIDEKMKNV